MRIAIFHDYLENIGGGEKLVLETAKNLNATVITTNVNKDAIKKLNFEKIKIIDLGKTPKNTFLRHFFISLKFFLSDFSKDFDYYIFSGNRSIFATWRHKPNLWYCHSPERAAFDLHDFYKSKMSFFKKIFFAFYSFSFKISFFSLALPNIQKIITNSKNTSKRIKKYLGKNSQIIYPPINTAFYKNKKSRGYWLSVNRLYPSKRIGLQLDAFKLIPNKKLFIIGGYVEVDDGGVHKQELLSIKPDNVSFLGTISEKELQKLYSECEGFIATASDEDFGMTVVEAMASGKAVVCVDEGGFRETVIDNKTGFLVNADPLSLANAVRKTSENNNSFKDACLKNAKKFDSKIYFEKIREVIFT
ncbi:MAG: mannosyl transferase [Candidatus Diapherotrites archaeon]|uniref:Mannosyl transferase n=1 Tax=Candidatus Iainarchaeum sp. TaxID=3101447 RepID=A0A2D6LPT2_9ARCH|nr:mannosyl transferase [Candidatus Diapherotrites archaeon]